MTHCRREVMHAQWNVLLDDEFIDAYMHGLVVKCCDGVMRRFYPRILTYSADYPEKYVSAGLFVHQSYLINTEFFWQPSAIKGAVPVLDASSLAPVFKISGWYKT